MVNCHKCFRFFRSAKTLENHILGFHKERNYVVSPCKDAELREGNVDASENEMDDDEIDADSNITASDAVSKNDLTDGTENDESEGNEQNDQDDMESDDQSDHDLQDVDYEMEGWKLIIKKSLEALKWNVNDVSTFMYGAAFDTFYEEFQKHTCMIMVIASCLKNSDIMKKIKATENKLLASNNIQYDVEEANQDAWAEQKNYIRKFLDENPALFNDENDE